MIPTNHSGPSERAKAAIGGAIHDYACGCERPWPPVAAYMEMAEAAAAACHNPALGEDRSVRLGDVLDALLRGSDAPRPLLWRQQVADFLLRAFTETEGARDDRR